MISKWKMEMLTFLTSLTLVSVGFSSWQISTEPLDLSATVGAETVVNGEDYLKLTEISMFDYNTDGFFSYAKEDKSILTFNTHKATIGMYYTVFKNSIEDADSPLINYAGYGYVQINCEITLKNSKGSFNTEFFKYIDWENTIFDADSNSIQGIVTPLYAEIDFEEVCVGIIAKTCISLNLTDDVEQGFNLNIAFDPFAKSKELYDAIKGCTFSFIPKFTGTDSNTPQ